VAGRLIKPRNYWPAQELITRGADTIDNPPVLDRRLQDLEPASRQMLALIHRSRQPCWGVANLIELMMALGHAEGVKPLLDLLEGGLLFPVLGSLGEGTAPEQAPEGKRLYGFELWLASPGPDGLWVFSPPQVASRAAGEEIPLPDLTAPLPGSALLSSDPPPGLLAQEADGLEWLLRLGVLWQQLGDGPLRKTQQGGYFKRDFERLSQDALLNGPPADRQADVRDLGFLLAELAEREGLVREVEGEIRAGTLPEVWESGLAGALASLWADLPHLRDWTPLDGWRGGAPPVGNPFPSAHLLVFLLLGRIPEHGWIRPDVVEAWIQVHHPYWEGDSLRPSRQAPWLEQFLLGVAYPLRLVQVGREPSGSVWVRLSPLGRWLTGQAAEAPPETAYPQTLLVQPNLEIVAFRQGLSAGLIAHLTRFAVWKTLGAACTLQLQPETVYRALEMGETFDSIRQVLEQHGTRALPPAVLDSLRTWANKRDRIAVYPSATLMEFASAADLNEALARGLEAVRIADTLAIVPSEDDIDFKHFRLTGTRDYALPPQKCVFVEPDGVTLTVDLSRSDLLLESELPRFAEPLERGGSANGRRQYRLTPASLGAARASGATLANLETWFQQRTGNPISPAARLLLTGAQVGAPRVQRHVVLHVELPELADGLLQWPETRSLLEGRLGPTALIVAEGRLAELRDKLKAVGVQLSDDKVTG
jgi:hypothetical protein